MKGNLYLTGMMGCGKTSIGRKAAKKIGKRFWDIDVCIEKEAGSTITQIFEALGESGFRKMETDMLRRIAGEEQDAVISCGGGIVLADENIRMMKQSGAIVYIERDMEEIEEKVDIENRPALQGDRENIKKIFESRKQRYEESCDYKILNDDSIEKAVDSLIALLEQ